ncbi:MAG: phosphotriesterase-related protein [Actinomycetia bacterium]|nr:phosphotriesterase-related protein [Actinomycetes bacterium]
MARVRTVLGEVDSADLGVTLCHEHLLLNGERAWHEPSADAAEDQLIAREPVRMEFLGRLRADPYLSLDNTRLDDIELAVAEAARYVSAGGRTLVEVTPVGLGRDPAGLRSIAERTGLTIVMGCGYYLERTQPPHVARMSVDELAQAIARDVIEGVDGVHAGVIGEIGVGLEFSPTEERVLRAAARAQVITGVPLCVHLPGWKRYGHRVLDVVESEGVDPHAVVLCHMNPSADDTTYQDSLAARGAWIEYDMLGMEFYYPGEGQSPCDEHNACAIAALLERGLGGALLLSHDVFLKTLLRAYGGMGYAHVLTGFAQRLERHGVDRPTLLGILTENPRAVFEAAERRR